MFFRHLDHLIGLVFRFFQFGWPDLGKISKHYQYYKSCGRSCTNFSSKICEQVLAVAQVKGVLNEFLAWFKGRRKRATMMDMVEQSGPKSAGKKPHSKFQSVQGTPNMCKFTRITPMRCKIKFPGVLLHFNCVALTLVWCNAIFTLN